MKIDRIDYTIAIEQVNEPQRNCESNCNEIMFVNKGAATCYVEKYPIVQDDFLTIGGNIGEYCTKNFNVQAPAGSNLFVFRKYYLNEKK